MNYINGRKDYGLYSDQALAKLQPCERVMGFGVKHGANCVCVKHEIIEKIRLAEKPT